MQPATKLANDHDQAIKTGGFYGQYTNSSGAQLLFAINNLQLPFTIRQATEFVAGIELKRKRKGKPKPKDFRNYCEDVVYNTIRFAQNSLCTVVWPLSLSRQLKFKAPVYLWSPEDTFTPDFHGISKIFSRRVRGSQWKNTRVIAHPMLAERWSAVLMNQTGDSPINRYLTYRWYHDYSAIPTNTDITWERLPWDWASWKEDDHPDPVLHSLSQTEVYLRTVKSKPDVAATWTPPSEWDHSLDASPSVVPEKDKSPESVLVGHHELCPDRLFELHTQLLAEKKGAQLW